MHCWVILINVIVKVEVVRAMVVKVKENFNVKVIDFVIVKVKEDFKAKIDPLSPLLLIGLELVPNFNGRFEFRSLCFLEVQSTLPTFSFLMNV